MVTGYHHYPVRERCHDSDLLEQSSAYSPKSSSFRYAPIIIQALPILQRWSQTQKSGPGFSVQTRDADVVRGLGRRLGGDGAGLDEHMQSLLLVL